MWKHVFKTRLVFARFDALQFPPTYHSHLIEREGKKAGKGIMGLMALICLYYHTTALKDCVIFENWDKTCGWFEELSLFIQPSLWLWAVFHASHAWEVKT